MEYQELKTGIKDHLNSAAEDFFMVGYFLRQISEKALFVEDGYESIWEFAKGEYGLSTSSASRFMAINARFSIDGGEHMAEKYIGMGVSKLQEMLGLPDEELEKVTQETTVREIRAMKAAKREKEQLSFYGLPRTVRPEGSLLTTPGCGDGKYDCFFCCRECAIRQEPRQCRTAPLGSPAPCTRVNNEDWKRSIAYSLYKEECQLLHPELAPVREGDKEPDPCCLHCEHKTCFNRCDVAKKRDEEERKKAQEEERQRQKEAEARRPEPSERDIKAFYDWAGIKATDNITADDLKSRYKNAGGGGGQGAALQDYTGSARGIRINYKKELTWVQLAKRIKETQEAEARKANFVERSNGAQKNVRDLIKQQEEKRQQEAEEKKAAQKQKEDGRLLKFYKDIYPSTRHIIAQRDKAAITKEFKTIYGNTYENGKGWMCYPDKIVFKDSPDAEQIQITWGRFTTKLVELLDRFPETEKSILFGDDTREKEPEIIDADFKEIEDEPKDDPAQELAEAKDAHEELDNLETQNSEIVEDPESYTLADVREQLRKCEADLKAYREVGGMPEFTLRKQKIFVDALQLLAEKKEFDEKEEAEID
mgnify:CR=1 FL=1